MINTNTNEMTKQEIKTQIESETGIKVTMRNIKKGSMKGYIYLTPRMINGVYPQFDFDYCQLNNSKPAQAPNYYNVSNIMVYVGNEVFS